MGLLGVVARSNGGAIGSGWNLVVLHHTDCGINCLVHSPEPLAKHFGVEPDELDALAITDPHLLVAIDVAKLKAAPALSPDLLVSGLVYDGRPVGRSRSSRLHRSHPERFDAIEADPKARPVAPPRVDIAVAARPLKVALLPSIGWGPSTPSGDPHAP